MKQQGCRCWLAAQTIGLMSDKGILGGKISNAIDVHQEALHLSLGTKVMLVLFLMQCHKKFSVI